LRHRDNRAVWRGWAEVASAQIGVFFELGRPFDVADRKGDVLDGRTPGFQARVDILADLLDLRPEVALADNIA
jgi:hypothetical protein